MTTLVCIEYVEDIVGEFCRLAEGEELLIYPTEFGLVEMTGRTVFLEALVPNRRISWMRWMR